MEALIAYDWPGNVRELENCIERGVALGSGHTVEIGDLPSIVVKSRSNRMPFQDEILPLVELERRAIFHTLRQTGDKLAAARMLGIGKTTLYRKLRVYNVDRAGQQRQYKNPAKYSRQGARCEAKHRLGRFSSLGSFLDNTGDPQSLTGYSYVCDALVILTDPPGQCTPRLRQPRIS